MARTLDREDLLVPATRYFMGRRTIGVTAHCDALVKAWAELSRANQTTIMFDLEDAFRNDDRMRADEKCSPTYYPLGDDIDRAAWERVRACYSQLETRTDADDDRGGAGWSLQCLAPKPRSGG